MRSALTGAARMGSRVKPWAVRFGALPLGSLPFSGALGFSRTLAGAPGTVLGASGERLGATLTRVLAV